jgi:phosphotransferase system enzyme I (PtsI)
MIYHGNPVSPGIAVGKVYVFKNKNIQAEHRETDSAERECAAYASACKTVEADLAGIVAAMKEKAPDGGEAKIFQAHINIVRDPELSKMISDVIHTKKIISGWAVEQVYDEFIDMFTGSKNEITAARAADMRDVRRRLLAALHGHTLTGLSVLAEPVVVVARDLLPSDTATMDREKVLAIVTEAGGDMSHTAILARSYGIPALLGVTEITEKLSGGEDVIVDALEGCLLTDPREEDKREYQEKTRKLEARRQMEQRYLPRESVTKDGVRIQVKLNIGSSQEADLAYSAYSDGSGLFRTEFLYMGDHLPGEEEQFVIYSRILDAYKGKPVILRTIDIGGDKQIPGLLQTEEMNPFLGRRALRLCFAEPEIFKTQLRAALRASVYGNLWIMFPMVGSMEDIVKAKTILREARQELEERGVPFARDIKIGVMIEVPAIAIIADKVVGEVDFASIGTNDLCQYLTAADRMNPAVTEYYQSFHPAMLRLIRTLAGIFEQSRKPLGVCGEMAADREGAALLIGLGISSLSVNSTSLGAIKSLICNGELKTMRKAADVCCELISAGEIKKYLHSFYAKEWENNV